MPNTVLSHICWINEWKIFYWKGSIVSMPNVEMISKWLEVYIGILYIYTQRREVISERGEREREDIGRK